MYEAIKVFVVSDTLVGNKVTDFWGRRDVFLLCAKCGVFDLDFARNNFYSARNLVSLTHIPPPIIFINGK
jgi:hypothetical protein